MSAISQDSVSILSGKMFVAAVSRLESLFFRLSEEVSKESGLSKEKVFDIWNKISPDCQVDFKTATEHEMKAKDQEEKKHKKREDGKGSIACQYQYGPNAAKANQFCNDPCKNDKPAADGKHYCTRHLRQKESNRQCVFVYGSKASNPGTECQARITKKAEEFSLDGTYEGKSYKGCYLCKKHQTQVTKAIDKKEKQCTHVTGSASKNPGTRCTALCKSGVLCPTHTNTKKAKEKTAVKDKEDKRKTLKKGAIAPKPEETESSEDESEVESEDNNSDDE
jgi:hypothetical protein